MLTKVLYITDILATALLVLKPVMLVESSLVVVALVMVETSALDEVSMLVEAVVL